MSSGQRWPALDESLLSRGVDHYLSDAEARHADIRPGAEKRVIWAGAPETRTAWAVVVVHGFSATSQEIRPVPDRVAAALGANLHFTRLTGHGRDAAAMGHATLQDWMTDMAEALAVGRAIGDHVLVIAVSTGGTLATLAAHDPMARGVAGLALIAPNYRVRHKAARFLTWPLARWWLPLLAGRTLCFTPRNAGHAAWWTTRYPSVAALPMGAAVAAARRLPHEHADIPALFVFDEGDRIVDHTTTRAVARAWGARAEIEAVSVGPDDDPDRHVIAGDILSPSMTGPVSARVADWAAGLAP